MKTSSALFVLISNCFCLFVVGDTDWDTCPSGCSYQVQQRFVTVTNVDNSTDDQRQFQLCKSTSECIPYDEDGQNCSAINGLMTSNTCYKLTSAAGVSFAGAFGSCPSSFFRLTPALLFSLRDLFLELMPYILVQAQTISTLPYAIWTGGYSQNGFIKWQRSNTVSWADFTMVNDVWDSWVEAPPANSSTKYCLAIVVESTSVVNMQWLDCSTPTVPVQQALCMLQGRAAVFNVIPGTISVGNTTQSLTSNGLSSRWFCALACKRQPDCSTAIYCPTTTSTHQSLCYTTDVKYTDPTDLLGFTISTTNTTECSILDRQW